MPSPSYHLLSLAAAFLGLILLAVFPQSVSAQTDFFWDQNGAPSGTGGTGNWDTSSSLWRSGSSTGPLGIWSTGNNAILGGTAGTVTLNTTGIAVTGLTFLTAGYTVAGSATNILTFTGTAPVIDVSTGTATFSTGRIEGTSGFTKGGTGSLVIQSTSAVSGAVNVSTGTLSLGTTTGTLTSATSVSVAQGATLQLNNTSGNNNNNRLGNIDVTLNGGTLNFVGLQAASGTSESISRVVLASGASTISLAGSTGSGAQLGTLTLGNATSGISRSTGATLNFDGDANGDIVSTSLATSNNIIGGWAVYTGTTAGWLKSVNGSLQVYVSTDAGYTDSATESSWTSTQNVDAKNDISTPGKTINSLIITGPGTSRTFTITSGTLVLSSGGLMATKNSGHFLTGGTVTAGTTAGAELFVFNNFGFTISSVIGNNAGGAVNLVKSGAGTLTLSGTTANTFTGTSYINEGAVTMSKSANVNALSGDVIINGGTLNYGSNENQIADSATVTLNAGTYNLGARTETIGVLTMTGGTLARGGATLTLSSASSITGGTLNFTAAAASRISTSSTLALGGATFSYDSATSPSIGTVTLGGDVSYTASNTAATTFSNSQGAVGRLEIGTGTRVFNIVNSNSLSPTIPEVTVGWTVTGSAALIKSGTGTLHLQQSNTYSGGTTVSAGTLNITNTNGSATGSGNLVVQDNATLQGSGRIGPSTGNSVTINKGGTVTIGDLNGTATQEAKVLTITPASGTITTTFENGSTFRFDLFTNAGDNTGIETSADLLRIGGSLTFQDGVILSINQSGSFAFANGNRWRLLDWTTLSGSTPTGNPGNLILDLPLLDSGLVWDVSALYTDGSITVVIPEPSRTLLLSLGALGLLFHRRRFGFHSLDFPHLCRAPQVTAPNSILTNTSTAR